MEQSTTPENASKSVSQEHQQLPFSFSIQTDEEYAALQRSSPQDLIEQMNRERLESEAEARAAAEKSKREEQKKKEDEERRDAILRKVMALQAKHQKAQESQNHRSAESSFEVIPADRVRDEASRYLIVNPVQRGNNLLKHLAGLPYKFGVVSADFLASADTAVVYADTAYATPGTTLTAACAHTLEDTAHTWGERGREERREEKREKREREGGEEGEREEEREKREGREEGGEEGEREEREKREKEGEEERRG